MNCDYIIDLIIDCSGGFWEVVECIAEELDLDIEGVLDLFDECDIDDDVIYNLKSKSL